MLKKSYLVIGSIIFCLLFSFNVNAAQSSVSGSGTTYHGETVTVVGNTFTQVEYNSVTETQNGQTVNWDIVQDIYIRQLEQHHYYTGEISFMVTTSPSVTLTARNNPILINNHPSDGMFVYIIPQNNVSYTVNVVFDNYYTVGAWIGLPTITQKYFLAFTQIADQNLTQNFTVSISSVVASNLRHSAEPYDGGLAKLITDSIDDSTALAVIAGWLYDIKEQDYTYYSSLTTQIANLINGQSTTNARLLSILNEIDLDFQQVQTILDLFPSYRTQVLQYWQDLLAMNAAQSSEAAEVESEYADKEAQSATLAAGLGQLILPSVSSNDFNVLNQVDGTQKANFFGLLSIITNNGFITTLLIIVVTGAIVGYILYGKK